MFIKTLVFLTVLLPWIFPKQALAYLDPGTGSYIIQIVIASLAGGVYLIAAFRERIKAFLDSLIFKLFKRQKNEEGK